MSDRCNGCFLEAQERRLGKSLLTVFPDDESYPGSVVLYELGAAPADGQGGKVEHEGQPVRFIAWLMSPGHACGKITMSPTQRDRWRKLEASNNLKDQARTIIELAAECWTYATSVVVDDDALADVAGRLKKAAAALQQAAS